MNPIEFIVLIPTIFNLLTILGTRFHFRVSILFIKLGFIRSCN